MAVRTARPRPGTPEKPVQTGQEDPKDNDTFELCRVASRRTWSKRRATAEDAKSWRAGANDSRTLVARPGVSAATPESQPRRKGLLSRMLGGRGR